jgi:hypothetical protein
LTKLAPLPIIEVMKALWGIVPLLLMYSSLWATPEDGIVSVVSSSPYEVCLEIALPPLQMRGKDINTMRMGNLEILECEGLPPIPFVSAFVAIDDHGGFRAAVERTETYDIALEELTLGSKEPYPSHDVLLDQPQILRDFRIVRFQYFPVQFIPEDGKLRIATRATIRIWKDAARGANEKPLRRERLSQAFVNLYRHTIINFDESSRFSSDTVAMLIITPDTYDIYLQPYVEWKEETGIITKVVKFSAIAPNPSYSQIRDFIYGEYVNSDHPPDYFLAIGDAPLFPVKYSYDYSGYPGSYANDNYFVCMDDPNEIFPDIFGARLPIHNSFQMETMVYKIINYEQNPNTSDPLWLRRALMVADNQFPSQAQTKHRVREKLLGCGYVDVDSIYAKNYSSSYSISAAITNAVNEGRGIVNYRGRGWSSGWHCSYGSIFNTSQVAAINNYRKTPIVTSVGCGVAKFDDYNCFGEQWLRNGTPTSEKGAVSFFGPTWNTHTRHNNKLDRGIYTGLIDEGLTTFGEATTRAKYVMYDICGPSDTTVTQMNEYLILGDPTLLIRTGNPESLTVLHPAVVPAGNSVLWVSVHDDGGAVEDAFVCARMEGSFHVAQHTNELGLVALPIHPLVPDTITITAIARNHFLYKGFCLAKDTGPFIIYHNHFIDDDSAGTSMGNGNGIPNPGESIELPVLIANKGNQDAIGVTALLSTQDIYTVITDSLETLGTVASDDSMLTPDDFDISISASAPDQHGVLFKLTLSDSGGESWESNFVVTIQTPLVELAKHRIDDAGQSNPNCILDPGETVNLICRLGNRGSTDAVNVSAILRSKNLFIHCIDSTSVYGDIHPSEEREGTAFIVEADSATPEGYAAGMKLVYYTADGYRDSTVFSITVGMGTHFLIWDLDLNKSSGPELTMALGANGYKGIYTTNIADYLHMLDAFQAIFICLGINPSNYVLEDGPTIDSLCMYLSGGGRMYMEGGDTWCYDIPTALHAYFRIPEEYDGFDDTQTIYGQYGTFTNQMSFAYVGENHWMDQLATYGGSFTIFRNSTPYYLNGIAYSGAYRTIGLSFEFGGLVDGSPPSTREILADSIMHFFGITGIEEGRDAVELPKAYGLLPSLPNPCRQQALIRFQVPRKSEVDLRMYDASGRLVHVLVHGKVEPGYHRLLVDTKGYANGVYFYRLAAGNRTFTEKMIVLK